MLSQKNGALKCTTCHDPHNIDHGKDAADHYNSVCRQCHAAAFTALVAAKQHTAQTGCIGCHMPLRRPVEVVHIVKTDHYIQRFKPTADLLADIPERHETLANSYRGEVKLYYPKSLPDTPANRMYVAIAQVRDKSNLAQGIPQLAAAIDAVLLKRPNLITNWGRLIRPRENRNTPSRRIATRYGFDPRYPAALLGLGAAFRQSGELAKAEAVYQQATEAAPDNPKAWNELGQVDLDLGRAPRRSMH